MNKILLLLLSTCYGLAFGQSYAPAAGEPGSTAISFDDTKFVAWATNVEVERGYINSSDPSATYEGSNKATHGDPSDAVGPATMSTTDVVSLGDSGIAIVTFATPITNGIGADFAVFENGFASTFLELAHVEVSSDGVNYFRFPSHSETQTANSIGGFGLLDPTYLYNLAGKYEVGFGTPFDLEELKNISGLDVNSITHIKLIDVVGSLDENGTQDSFGNKINDPYPTPFASGGFDLNAVGVINEKILDLSTEVISFNVYPNPSKGFISINLNNSEAKELKITNSLGKQIEILSLVNSNGILNFELAKGIYFIHVSNSNSVRSKRIVIQ